MRRNLSWSLGKSNKGGRQKSKEGNILEPNDKSIAGKMECPME
jgi:hypothetical protein